MHDPAEMQLMDRFRLPLLFSTLSAESLLWIDPVNEKNDESRDVSICSYDSLPLMDIALCTQ